jgi:hypothetical protein
MGPTQISVAIIMVGMVVRVGLEPENGTLGEPRRKAIKKEARRRCV